MEVKNTTNLSFQARVPKKLKNALKNEALNYDIKVFKNLRRKIETVDTWGRKDSTIDFTKSGLSLSNQSIAPNCSMPLPQRKKGFLSTFMTLKKRDIFGAEYDLERKAYRNQH